jgi:aspartyl protease
MAKLMALGSLAIIMVALPCYARSSRHSSQPGAPSILLHLMGGRPVVDNVFLNGQGPFRFLLDTGAQTNQVQASIASKFGLAPTFRVEMATASGTILVAGGRIGEVSLGSATASNQEFLFTSLDGVHAFSTDIQGVLGQEFLTHFDYLLDFAGHRLIFGAILLKGGTRVDFEMNDGRPTIETSEGKLVLDSGTDTTILFRESSSAPGGRVRTASGSASVSMVQSLRLRIAGCDYRPAIAASLPRVSLGEDGLLPASLFHAVYIGNSGKYAILNPRVDSAAAGPR